MYSENVIFQPQSWIIINSIRNPLHLAVEVIQHKLKNHVTDFGINILFDLKLKQ